jgi:hypothetical protein
MALKRLVVYIEERELERLRARAGDVPLSRWARKKLVEGDEKVEGEAK